MHDATIVVPCYNEVSRIDRDRFVSFSSLHPQIRILLVDDGSTDDTWSVLGELAAGKETIDRLQLPRNMGKAEAVRTGVCQAMDLGPDSYVGYWDADLATPLEAIPDFIAKLEESSALQVVMGARVQLLGRTIERSAKRHYVGRVFATAAALTLGVQVYDTQCGAKLFRGNALTRELFSRPFEARWIFDVEILARMARSGGGRSFVESAVFELPLTEWRDVKGSRLRPKDYVRAAWDMARIHLEYRQHIRPSRVTGGAGGPRSSQGDRSAMDSRSLEVPEVHAAPPDDGRRSQS